MGETHTERVSNSNLIGSGEEGDGREVGAIAESTPNGTVAMAGLGGGSQNALFGFEGSAPPLRTQDEAITNGRMVLYHLSRRDTQNHRWWGKLTKVNGKRVIKKDMAIKLLWVYVGNPHRPEDNASYPSWLSQSPEKSPNLGTKFLLFPPSHPLLSGSQCPRTPSACVLCLRDSQDSDRGAGVGGGGAAEGYVVPRAQYAAMGGGADDATPRTHRTPHTRTPSSVEHSSRVLWVFVSTHQMIVLV